uniref:Putative secreted protein n=1 Tax=Anopheles darlingi TaxID=43151 RepID=A0A2M4DK94_ANODA
MISGGGGGRWCYAAFWLFLSFFLFSFFSHPAIPLNSSRTNSCVLSCGSLTLPGRTTERNKEGASRAPRTHSSSSSPWHFGRAPLKHRLSTPTRVFFKHDHHPVALGTR